MTVKVYRFQYFDHRTGAFAESRDHATEKAIKQMGAVPLYHTLREAPESDVGFSGIARREWEKEG